MEENNHIEPVGDNDWRWPFDTGSPPLCKYDSARRLCAQAWTQAEVHADTKLKIDAVARAPGEPVAILNADWKSLVAQF